MPQKGHFIVGRSQHGDTGQIKREGEIVETSKPDLMAASPRKTQDRRILAQLEHGPKAPAITVRAAGWTIDGWTIGLCALLLLMCSVAWLMHDKRITPETFRPAPSSAGPQRPAVTVKAPVVEAAAAIVNEPAPEAMTAPPAATTGAGGNAADQFVPAGRSDAAQAAPQAGVRAASGQTPTAVTAALANNAGTQHASRAASTRPAATPRAPTATSPAQAGTDTDVTLLTALAAHAGKPVSVTPERSRDVVDRQDGDSTAQLLARCKQLGMIEGMLCRSRICSGRWEADAACRAPTH